MKKFKQGRFKVIIYAAAILLVGIGVLLASVTIAQGAEENRVIAEQSENTSLSLALATPTAMVTPVSATAQAVITETEIPVSATPRATETERVSEFPDPTIRAVNTPGPEFITEDETKEAYTWVATEVFGLEVEKNELMAQFNNATEYNTHESWSVTGPDAECSVDAISGDVLMFFSSNDEKYTGEKITLEEFDSGSTYNNDISENPNNAYSKLAAEIVNLKYANGRNIDKIMIDGIQFVWDNNGDGFDPKAKGTIQVDAKVLMATGRSYCLSFWGTNQLELKIFSSHPTKDACLWGYFYEDQADEYSGHA